ncbi:DMT family transporter [Trichococcus patagoniensis]|nr:EamA family transporter [Trichococcus patagoniensis]
MQKTKNQAQLYAFVTVLLWASAFVFTKIALTYYTAEAIGVLRYVIASLLFIAIGIFYKIGLPEKKDIPKFLLAGVLGFALYMITFNQASKSLTAATGSVVIASAPILTALFARIIFKEKIKVLGWIAIIIEFFGILILTLWNGILSVNAGIFWMFGAAVCISGYNLLQRSLLKKYSALQATAYSVLAGTLFLLWFLPDATVQFGNAPLQQLLVMGFLGVFPSALAYMLWSKALTMARKTSDITNYMFVTPLLAAFMGFLIMGEIPTLATYVGGLMIFAGLLLFKKSNT